jgi:hypothetical protein
VWAVATHKRNKFITIGPRGMIGEFVEFPFASLPGHASCVTMTEATRFVFGRLLN